MQWLAELCSGPPKEDVRGAILLRKERVDGNECGNENTKPIGVSNRRLGTVEVEFRIEWGAIRRLVLGSRFVKVELSFQTR